jgi:DNA polymerase-3 subunit gamma/tau
VENVASVPISDDTLTGTRSAKPGAPAEPVELAELWTKVMDGVSRASPFARTYFLEAHPVSLVRNILTIGYAPQFAEHLGLVDNARNRTLVQTKLQELGYPGVEVRFIQAEPPPGWARPELPAPVAGASEPATAAASAAPVPPAAPAAASAPEAKAPKPALAVSKEDFKNDPLIKQALEIFKGQIVEVRA